ncbi:MAG TPA: hypothetical protein VGH19_16420 [Verrucomicrobiae bacterium]
MLVSLAVTFLLLGLRYRDLSAMPIQPTLCQSNLFLLDEAISNWAATTQPVILTNSTDIAGSPPDRLIKRYFPDGIIPTCPAGATYQRGSFAMASTCPLHGVAQRHPSGSKLLSAFHRREARARYLLNASKIGTNATIQCRNNLFKLWGGLEQWALEFNQAGGDPVSIPLVLERAHNGGRAPICPSGGKYYFTVASNFPCCTITGHTIQ